MQLSPNHPFFTAASDISHIIAPLKAYDITYFAYAKSYADGSRIMLTNRVDDFQAYLTNKHYLQGNCEAKPDLYKQQSVLWSTLPNQHLYQFAKENFDIDHGLTLVAPSENYCEFFAFASSHDHPEVANFYLNNLDIIKRFTSYFKDKASDVIKQVENHKIMYPHHHDAIRAYSMSELQELFTNIKITPRQTDCINLLLEGVSTKEIAAQLKLSPRTVEYYIDILRAKFHAQNKSDLIIKLLSYKANT
jgi:DNA-binding CsgD family transcriptional regulator